jgi:hypothetical protein
LDRWSDLEIVNYAANPKLKSWSLLLPPNPHSQIKTKRERKSFPIAF